ncbi:MAG: RluA family pseudouridine synthase [Firmicutes bacterium]|nr:RluA family pseudouridine synthase [Bacillota bacterium]
MDRFLMKMFPQAPLSLIYKALRTKTVKVNAHRADPGDKLNAGDHIQVYFSDERAAELGYQKKTIPTPRVQSSLPSIPIIYEDEQVIFFNKPAGVLSQKDTPESYSLSEYIVDYLAGQGEVASNAFRPAICNRLDRGTTGIVAGGKSLGALQSLTAMIREHSSEKTYLAICHGQCHWKKEMWLCHRWSKDSKRNQVSLEKVYVSENRPYNLIKEGQVLCRAKVLAISSQYNLTLFSLQLITGKSHQLRAQLAAEGFPMVGDHKYMGKEKKDSLPFPIKNQLLHAYTFKVQDALEPLQYLEHRTFAAPISGDFMRVTKLAFAQWVPIFSNQGE